jgi:hypothetical protein
MTLFQDQTRFCFLENRKSLLKLARGPNLLVSTVEGHPLLGFVVHGLKLDWRAT